MPENHPCSYSSRGEELDIVIAWQVVSAVGVKCNTWIPVGLIGNGKGVLSGRFVRSIGKGGQHNFHIKQRWVPIRKLLDPLPIQRETASTSSLTKEAMKDAPISGMLSGGSHDDCGVDHLVVYPSLLKVHFVPSKPLVPRNWIVSF
ncbi:hypothetical protein AMTRI_Chr12g269410 [Amborella trichopoda]